ncbi:MAG: glycosyltransferase [Pseudomonadota bacterium]
MADIAFLNATGGDYSGQTVREKPLRGVQSGTILLAEALVARGHRVSVFNGVAAPESVRSVAYRPFGEASRATADLVIANNNMREFDHGPAKGRRVVWMRNPANLRTLLKKGNLLPLLRHRPDGVFLSRAHLQAVPRVVWFRRRHIIELGTDAVFLDTPGETTPRAPRAIFFSQFIRGLDEMLEIWRRHIHPRAPAAEFHLCGDLKHRDGADFARFNIVPHGKVTKAELAALLRSTRALLYQGHRQEAGCNAAIEAYATGNAIVTKGIGVLGERVDDGVTGFIRPDAEAFGKAAARVLTDDALWLDLHRNALAHWSVKPWSARAEEWEAAFLH